jgi:hypothetical protein
LRRRTGTTREISSNLTTVFAREVAYAVRELTWEEMMLPEERFEVELKLRW